MSADVVSPSSKHFIWGWGRLTPQPLLLTHAATQPNTGGGGGTKQGNGNGNGNGSSSTSNTPNRSDSMETHSVRSIQTAAYHTIALTHNGGLYSWLHSPEEREGPATEEFTPSIRHTNVTAVTSVARSSRSTSRAHSPVMNRSERNSSAASEKPSSLSSAAAAVVPMDPPEKKFKRVLVNPTKHVGLGVAPSPPSISSAALGRGSMLAVSSSGQVLSWDWSVADSALGPTRLPTHVNLPPSTAHPSTTPLVNGLACGGQFQVLSTTDGGAYSWGKLGTHGRLGQGPPHTASSPTIRPIPATNPLATPERSPSSGIASSSFSSLSAALLSTSPHSRTGSPQPEKHAQIQPKPMSLAPEFVVSKVAAGWAHGALVLASGGVASFGCGLGGRLGSGNQLDQWVPQPVVGLSSVQIVDVACGYHHTLVVDVSGRVWSFGGNECGQLGLGDHHARATPELVQSTITDEVVALSCGAFHSAVVTAVGDLYTFGNGKCGQLGFGDTKSISTPRLVSALNGMDVCLVACGGEYTIAVTDHFMVMQMDYFSQAGAGVNGGSRDHSNSNSMTLAHEDENTIVSHKRSADRDQRSRSTSVISPSSLVASASSPKSQSPAGVNPSPLTSTTTRMSRSNSGSNLPSIPQNHSLRSSSPATFSTSIVFNNTLSSVPTPIIFEEREVDNSSSSSSSSSRGYHQHDEESSDHVVRNSNTIRASVSSNALSDLVNSSATSSVSAASASSSSSSSSNSILHSKHHHPPATPNPHTAPRNGSHDSPSLSHAHVSRPTLTSSKTIFELVKEAFSFPVMVHPDLKTYLPTAKPIAMNEPIEPSDILSPPPTPSANAPVSDDSFSAADFRASPSGLIATPPNGGGSGKKSSAEVARQREEVHRMNAAYKVKLRKEAKGKALLREQEAARRKEQDKTAREMAKRNLDREQKMDDAADIWLKQILPSWSSAIKQKKTRELLFRIGIPPRVRGQVWPLALGNALMITPELYDIFGQQATRARKQMQLELKQLNNAVNGDVAGGDASNATAQLASPSRSRVGGPHSMSSPAALTSSPSFTLGKESTFAYIDVDLTRTYPSLAFFQEECPMNDQLRHLLYTYCFYRPDVGYVQGMSYLAGNLLLYMTPFDAFVSFCHLLNSPFFHVFLKLEQRSMEGRYRIFEELFHETEHDLYTHFQHENITCELYFMEWCMTLFCKRLKLDVVGRVWDLYLVCGEVIVYRTGVAILKALKKELLHAPFDKIMKRLNATPLELSEEEVMNAMADVRFSSSLRQKLKAVNPYLPDE